MSNPSSPTHALCAYSPASPVAFFQLQVATAPTDPRPSCPPERCKCGETLTTGYILLNCPRFRQYILGQPAFSPALWSSSPSLVPPRSHRHHPSHPSLPKAGRDRRHRPLISKHGSHRRGHRSTPLAQPPNPLPQARPSSAPSHEVESVLALVGVALPAHVRVGLFSCT